MTIKKIVFIIVAATVFSSFASAQNITGTVTNGTTNKPAAGAEVTLLALSQGMQEIGTSKTDAQGHFSFPAPKDQQAPHMVRVTYQGVSYFPQTGPLMPGSTTANLTVYDSVKKVDGLSQTVEVYRFQSDGKLLEGVVLYALNNQSEPPRTQASDKGSFEAVLPEDADVETTQARGPGGQPIQIEANAGAEKGHYLLNYPIRPGETQFQIAFRMPYSGDASFSPKPVRDIQHFVVMTPKSISFEAKNAQSFQQMQDAQSTIMVATNVKPGADLSFRIAGTGDFPADSQQGAQGGGGDAGGGSMGGGAGAQSPSAANDNRPGGGLGAPIDAPDPLHDYRVYILGAFALVLVMGGAYIVSRSNRPQPAVAAAGGVARTVEAGSPEAAAAFADFVEPTAPARDRNALLLEAMKEELFQLEIDRQQGKVSPEEYTKAKSALDETIKRALARGRSS
jgi:5-hydroxyisourate hydrolase-like protein (transthyretin family)